MKTFLINIFLISFLSLDIQAYCDEDEIKLLKEQVTKILKRLDVLEKRVSDKKNIITSKTNDTINTKPPTKQKGILELKNADTVLSVGGMIQLDTHYDWPASSHSAKSIQINDIDGENGHITFDSRYSRVWVKTRTPSKYGMIRSLIETDFLGSAGTETNTNSSGLRLRHAYVSTGKWTAGQTNSAFNTFVPLDILQIPINDVFARQALIRYSNDGKLYSWDLSFEQPESTLLDPDGNIITPKDDLIPDIVARLRYYPSWGEMGLSLMGRYINQDCASISVNGSSTALNNKDSAIGWAGNISAKINIGNSDDIRLGAHYGMGIGRYLAYNAYAAGSIDANGNIKLQPSYGGQFGYRHWWNKELRSTVSVSYAGTKNNMEAFSSSADNTTINKEAYSSQLNLLWTPLINSLIGVEYTKARRTVQSGEDGELDAAMLRIRYDF